MATQLAVDLSGLGNALGLSLDNWGRVNPKYKDLYKTLSRESLQIAQSGLNEMGDVTPMNWVTWWAKEHNRFIREKGVKQRDLILLHEIMHQFLVAFTRGELGHARHERSGATAKGKAKAKS
jgi:hypothetical protein